MILSPEQAQDIRNIVENVLGCEVYEQYSGRCMFGARCFGIVYPPDIDLFGLCGALHEHSTTGICSVLADTRFRRRTDNMGRSMIVYWEQIQWPHEEDKESVD